MTTFVLVHGSWHGAWCWYRLTPVLRGDGHEVVTPELPGHGISTADSAAVTFEDYVDCVRGAVESAPGDVVLVGHSMGGHVITQAAEHCADALESVVYLSAFLPADGQALTDLDIAPYGSVVPDYITVDADRGVVEFDERGAAEAFYHDCSAEVVTLGRSLLRPEPADPRTVPVDLTAENYGRVPRVYVESTADRALPIEFQRSMHEAVACERVYSLDTSHSPFFSKPSALAGILSEIADR
ncbi:alpha/beta fold hydrolase [Halobellus sp. GM3]|uniref:alpha/beta fold hydrolase n=1 Tax=Halobellus sp. GM3 TaxID=3458410 RepID=UPI00403DD7A5